MRRLCRARCFRSTMSNSERQLRLLPACGPARGEVERRATHIPSSSPPDLIRRSMLKCDNFSRPNFAPAAFAVRRCRSPDGAERNPGTNDQLHCPSWVSLRSTQATKLFAARFRQIMKDMERRQTHCGQNRTAVKDLYASGAQGAPRTRRLAPPFRFGRARLPAFHSRHLRQRPNATAQLQFTRFLGRDYAGTGVIRPLPPQCSGVLPPQTGRSAGRAFWPGAARERG